MAKVPHEVPEQYIDVEFGVHCAKCHSKLVTETITSNIIGAHNPSILVAPCPICLAAAINNLCNDIEKHVRI